MKKRIVYEYNKVLLMLARVALPLSSALVPSNLEEQRKSFLEGKIKNPIFRYKKIDINNSVERLEKLSKVRYIEGLPDELVHVLKKIIKSKLNTARLIKSIGNDKEFSKLSQKKYSVPSEKSVANALKVLRNKHSVCRFAIENSSFSRKLDIGSVRLANIFYDILQKHDVSVSKSQYGDNVYSTSEEYRQALHASPNNLPNTWRVLISKESGSSVRVGNKFRVIFVPPNAKFSKYRVKKLVVHELLTHVLRAYNGFATGYEFLGKPTISSYIYTEEGLALYNEEIAGLLSKRVLKKIALLVYNVYLAHKQGYSFRDLFNINITFFVPREAFDIAYRVKRGLKDTSLPGGYTKDAVYLRGYLLTRMRIKKDPSLYRKLYAGKIPYKWINLVDDKIINYPIKVPDVFNVSALLNNI